MNRPLQSLGRIHRTFSNHWKFNGAHSPTIGNLPSARRLLAPAIGLFVFAAAPALALDARDQLQFADGLYARGLHELASKEYLSLVTNTAIERLDTVLFRLGECQRLLGNKAAADKAYDELIRRFPKSEFRFRGEYRRAEMHVSGGAFIEAVSYFRALLAANPPDDIRGPALYYYGFAQDRLMLTNDAEAAYGEIVTKFPQSPFFSLAAVSLGELKEKRGVPAAETRDLYTRAAAQAASPRVGAEALFKLGDLEFRHKNYAASADAHTKLLATYPKDERAVSNQLAIAWAYHNAARYPAALQLATANMATATPLQIPEWLYVKANCERQLKQEDAAIADYETLLKKYPGSTLAGAAAYENAVLLFQRNRFADVLAVAPAIAATNAAGTDVAWMLAESYAATKQIDPAVAHYKKIIALAPQSDRAALSQFRIAKLFNDAGRHEDASASYRAVAKQFPAHALAGDALASSAACQLKIGRKDGAITDWAELAKISPDYAALDEALFAKSQAEVDLGKSSDARATLEQLFKMCPRSPLLAKGHYVLGVLLEKSNEFDPAAYHYAAALALKPDAELQQTIGFRRVAVLQRQGKNDDAAAMLQPMLATPAVAKIPPPMLDWLARWQLARPDFAAAAAAATNLIVHATDEQLKLSGWFVAGCAFQGLKKHDDARKAFETVIAATNKTGRESIEASLHLGEVALAMGDANAAVAAFSRAAEKSGTDALLDIRARSYHGLGLASAALQKWEETGRYFMSVAVLFEDKELTPECLWRAADAFAHQNKPDEKQKALEELTRRYPGSEWAKKQP